MRIFKRRRQLKTKVYLKLILEELQDIHSVMVEIENRNQRMNWELMSQENDIKKLKEENKNLKKKLKEEKCKKQSKNCNKK